MPITNEHTRTRIDEIADRIYRISTPVSPNPALPTGFTFNQFLIVDEEPLLFHAGMRKLFPVVRDAVASVMPVDRLRWISFSHHEADEDGALAEWLAIAPRAEVVCGQIGTFFSVIDSTDRAPRVLADGELMTLGDKRVQWFDTPHVPHGWDAGLMLETMTRTLFCADLLTQPGDTHAPVTEDDVLGPSETMRNAMEYYSNPAHAATVIERLAASEPALLATMHGAAYRGQGAAVLRELAATLRRSA
jgi:flavorubredoxin